jgi:hypothetical protein
MLRNALITVLVTLAGLACWVGFASSGRTDVKALDKAPPYVHTVILYLKKDAPEGEADALIADAMELLKPIPSIREMRVGKPAEKATPEYAKKDYQVGLVIFFDDFEGLDTYLKHPNHLKYVDKHLKHLDTEKMGVYDFIQQKK